MKFWKHQNEKALHAYFNQIKEDKMKSLLRLRQSKIYHPVQVKTRKVKQFCNPLSPGAQ